MGEKLGLLVEWSMVLASIFSIATIEACFWKLCLELLDKHPAESLPSKPKKDQSLKTNATALSRKNFKLSRLKRGGVRLVLQPYPL